MLTKHDGTGNCMGFEFQDGILDAVQYSHDVNVISTLPYRETDRETPRERPRSPNVAGGNNTT